jgi:hypothetical protein
MFRKLILSAMLTTGAVTDPALTPATADAHPPMVVVPPTHFHHVRFEVLVLRHGCWEVYDVYRDRDDARRAAWRLRHCGLAAEVRRV